MRALLEVLGRDRDPPAELRVSGHAASLRTWNQIKADVLGTAVLRVPGDATAAGVAMLAGIGAGVYSGPGEAVTAACHPEEPVLPDPGRAGLYDAAYRRYRAVRASDLARVLPPGPGG
jgi:sugar (pentulose or hexulose) kinase